jgi:tetratricopeptide (TPR) repeat protein
MRSLLFLLLLSAFISGRYAQNQGLDVKGEALLLDQLRILNPDLVQVFKQATERMGVGDYKNAVPLFQKIVDGAPSFDAGYRRLGTCLVLAGDIEKGMKFIVKAVGMNRSPDNLAMLARFEAFPGPGKTATPEAKERALRLFKEVNQQTNDPFALFLTAQIAMDLREQSEFRSATLQLMKSFPNRADSHYLNAILAATDKQWATAEEEIRRAEGLGLSHDLARQFLDSGVHRRASEWRYATYVGYAVIGWMGGLTLLFLIGKILSRMTLRSVESTANSRTMVRSKDAGLRKIYRWLIQFAGWYYYISLPFVGILLIAVAASVFYAFLAIGQLPLRLLFFLAVMTLGTIYMMFRSLFVKVKPRDPGRILTFDEAPGLWALTREVAADIVTRPVDEIRITPGTDVAVYERGTRKEKAQDKAKRILILGVGVLNGFRLQPFRAVLAHEYGHFTNRDTAGGDVALRVNYDMIKFAYAMALAGQAVWWNLGFLFFRIYHFLFRRISHGASRLQEILADRTAALKYGADAFEEGLTHAIRRATEFPINAGREITASVDAGRALQNVYGLHTETEAAVEEQIKKALNRPTTEDDTHPSAADRFRLVRAFGSVDHPADSSMVWDLFRDREAIMMEMTTLIDRSVPRRGKSVPDSAVPTFREVQP